MPYPRKLLSQNEVVKVDLKPHWLYFFGPAATSDRADRRGHRCWSRPSTPPCSAGSRSSRWSSAPCWLVGRFVRWRSTYFVITNDKLIYRSGVFPKSGVQIPLERVNSVNFKQNIVERIVGAGDLLIESGGHGRAGLVHRRAPPRQGADHPARRHRGERHGHHHVGRRDAATGPRREPPAADARRCPRRRPTWPASSSGSKGCCSAARSPGRSSRPRSAGCSASDVGVRVVSLVPSVTETLLAWGVAPVAVTRFCQQPRLASRRGHEGSLTSPRIVALAPDLVVMDDEENRREDADALEAAGLSLHVTHVRRLVDDVGAHARRAAPAVGWRRAPRPRIDAVAGSAPRRGPSAAAGVRPDLAPAVDDHERRHLRLVGAGRPRRRQRVRRRATTRYPTTTLEEAAARRPDLVLAPDRALPLRRAPPARAAGRGGRRPPGRRPGPVLVGRPHAGRARRDSLRRWRRRREADEAAVAVALGAPHRRRPPRGRAARRRAGTRRSLPPGGRRVTAPPSAPRASSRSSSSDSTTNVPGTLA